MVKKKIEEVSQCQFCRFFLIEKNEELGECRRNPPSMYVEDDEVGYSFPVVPLTEWCGEFQRKLDS